jgi:hypothetical protein
VLAHAAQHPAGGLPDLQPEARAQFRDRRELLLAEHRDERGGCVERERHPMPVAAGVA